MRLLILLSLFLSSISQAEKTISWGEVVSAFTWLRIGPDFPVILSSESDEQVSFRIFEDAYTITRDHRNYLVRKDNETITLDSLTLEKALKFVNAKRREDAQLDPDYFRESKKQLTPPEGFQESTAIDQCASDLPARNEANGSIFHRVLHHTWLQNGVNESFGMPNTDEATYFGGRAHIRTPDSFIVRGPKHLTCSPVWIPKNADQKKMTKRIACVARSLTLPQDTIFGEKPLSQEWVAHFDYHVFERNCLMATRFVLECAGAKVSIEVNEKIGGKFDWNDPYSVSEVSAKWRSEVAQLQLELQHLRNNGGLKSLESKALEILDRAIELDSELRGVSGSQAKSLRDICSLSLQRC